MSEKAILGGFQFHASWSFSVRFHFCVHFVCDCQFCTVLIASDWQLRVFILVYGLAFCASIFVCGLQICEFLRDFQMSVYIFVCELEVFSLSLSLIKTFSFACSCRSVTFSFVSLAALLNSSFACLCASVNFKVCLSISACNLHFLKGLLLLVYRISILYLFRPYQFKTGRLYSSVELEVKA